MRLDTGMRSPAVVVVLAAAVLVVALIATRAGERVATPSPSPTVAATSPTPTASLTASPTPSRAAPASPSAPPAPTRFVNAALRYSIELPPPWHRTDCGSFAPRSFGGELRGQDTFINIPDREFVVGHTGIAAEHVYVGARANPQRLTPREWAARERSGTTFSDVTFAGPPAALAGAGTDAMVVFVARAELMYEIGHRAARTHASNAAQREAIMRSFRFEPNAVAPSPTPPSSPARSPEEVADILVEGFAKKDVALLARVLAPCVSLGVAQGGGTARDDEAYLDELRQRFARGLTVTVRPRPLEGTRTGDLPTLHARSTWREPGQPDQDVDLMISPDGDAWYWRGAVTWLIPRPSP